MITDLCDYYQLQMNAHTPSKCTCKWIKEGILTPEKAKVKGLQVDPFCIPPDPQILQFVDVIETTTIVTNRTANESTSRCKLNFFYGFRSC